MRHVDWLLVAAEYTQLILLMMNSKPVEAYY
jgi:hypothetical protein